VETSTAFAVLLVVFTELPTFAPVCAFTAIVAGVAKIISSPVLDAIRAEIVVQLSIDAVSRSGLALNIDSWNKNNLSICPIFQCGEASRPRNRARMNCAALG